MNFAIIQGLLYPLVGTTIGAASVYVIKDKIPPMLQRLLTGFAAGIMVAASFFSLLNPALEQNPSILSVSLGFLVGMCFLLVLDTIIPHMHLDHSEEGMESGLKKTTKLLLAVTLHNLPEGMAVGVIYAGWMYGNHTIALSSATVLAMGIMIQNIPEGAIVSMPLLAEGMNKHKTFLYGFLSGVVEPLGALLTIWASSFFVPMLPFFLSFAAGAMIYVVVEELIPEMSEGKHTNWTTIVFACGFVLMMILDITLG